ncbi:hypothetical protein NDU88_003541 [Pleurodeles waltl]|uniref:Uncharacterized protein n=1 Tax=Pleurodeles waltl TaxID=8319 RepID=A0AAV7NIH1_PLEWA|nr:hypothetical protein NDU88_003541 [Pleurodeles waltl]
MPKPLFGRADRRWDPERWRPVAETRTAGPGEHTSELPRFRRSVANPGQGQVCPQIEKVEAIQQIPEDGLPIGSLPPTWDLTAVKKRLPPFHRRNDGSWSTKELTGEEERKPKEDAAPEDAKTTLRTSGPTLGSRTVETRCRDEDRWPRGAHE